MAQAKKYTFSVETDNTYTKYEALADAKLEHKANMINGIASELYRVDKFGVCHSMKKYGVFQHEFLAR